MSAAGGAGGVGVHNAAYIGVFKGLRDRVPPEGQGELAQCLECQQWKYFRMPVVRPGTAPR